MKDKDHKPSPKDLICIRYDWNDGTRTRVYFPRQNNEQPLFRKIVQAPRHGQRTTS